MVRNKKGVDAVVATVLIIMITVAAVAIIWVTVIPMIKNSLTDSTAEKVSLTIDDVKGWTVYDETTGNVKVQIQRGVDSVNLTGIKVIFFNGTETKIYSILDLDLIPNMNSVKTVGFQLGTPFGKPTSISLAPVVSGVEQEVIKGISSLGSGVKSSSSEIYSKETSFDENGTKYPLPVLEGDLQSIYTYGATASFDSSLFLDLDLDPYINKFVRFSGSICVSNSSWCIQISGITEGSCWNSEGCLSTSLPWPLIEGQVVSCEGGEDKFYIYSTEQECLDSIN